MTLGLVLSGGGALGAFEAGVLEAVAETGLEPTILSGTSAGALNAAGLAIGMTPEELSDVWRRTTARDVYRLRLDLFRLLRLRGLVEPGGIVQRLLNTVGWTWLLDTGPLRRTITGVLGGERALVRDGVRLVVSAVDLAGGDVVRFCNVAPEPPRRSPRYREVDLDADHLMASAAIPLLFRPATVAGHHFWDGGLLANTPLAPALAYEPDAVIVVMTSTQPRPAPEPRTLGEAISLVIDTVIGYSLRADLAHAETINRLCDVDPSDPRRRVDLLLVEPVGLDLGQSLDFSPGLAQQRIRAGRELGRRLLASWHDQGRLPA